MISREKNLRPAQGGGVKGPEIGRHRGHQQGAQNGQQTAAAEEPETQQQETCQESLGRLGRLGIPHGFHGNFSEKDDSFQDLAETKVLRNKNQAFRRKKHSK